MSLWYFCCGMSSRLFDDGCRDMGAYTWAPKYCCLSGHCSAEHWSGSPLGPSAAEAGSSVKLCRGSMHFMWLDPLLWKLAIGPDFLLAVPFLCASPPFPLPRLLSISQHCSWHIWVGASWASVQHISLVLPWWLPSVISQEIGTAVVIDTCSHPEIPLSVQSFCMGCLSHPAWRQPEEPSET